MTKVTGNYGYRVTSTEDGFKVSTLQNCNYNGQGQKVEPKIEHGQVVTMKNYSTEKKAIAFGEKFLLSQAG